MIENETPESCTTKAKSFWSDFYAAPCFWLKVIFIAIILGLAIFGLCKIVTSAFYYFDEPLSYFDPERLGQLGDFLGGTLNPIFGFATVCLLLWSVFIQRKELSSTKDELKKQANLAIDEYNRKQLESTIEDLQKRYNEILDAKFSQVIITYEDFTDASMMPNKIETLNGLMRIISHINGKIKYPENLLPSLRMSNDSKEIFSNANITMQIMANLLGSLIAITKNASVKEYWIFRAKTLIDQACLVEILNTDEKDQLFRKIGLYS